MMSTIVLAVLLLGSLTSAPLAIAGAQQQGGGTTQERRFISVNKHTQEDDERILKLYDGLRVADVSDGMDMAGLQDVGLMDPDIKPLWRDVRISARH
jgi:4-hydroxy-4-methyl-2-oxoglutarate aldolase